MVLLRMGLPLNRYHLEYEFLHDPLYRYSESFLFCVVFQIISFLQQNAHPRVADKIPAVPENVTDQVQLNKAMFSSMANRICQSN
jgi:hypothetical protein